MSEAVAAGESCSTSINQNSNTLMQELDRFDGMVIVTTNLFKNYDPALLRRIQRHIHFKLPDEAMTRKLERDSRGQHGCRSGEVANHAGDAGAGD